MNQAAPPSHRPGSAWRVYLILVGLLVGAVLALDVLDQGVGIRAISQADETDPTSISAGDMDIRQCLLPTRVGGSESYVTKAIDAYHKAGSGPKALRRIIVAKSALLKKSADDELRLLAARGTNYASEAEMWRAIHGPEPISQDTARQYASRIRELNLGPLIEVAISNVYERSGQAARANAAMQSARDSALVILAVAFGLVVVYIIAGVAGLILGIMFFVRHAAGLRNIPAPRLQPSVLLISFLVYFVAYMCLDGVFGIGVGILGFTSDNVVDTCVGLVFQLLSMAGAFALGLAAFRNLTVLTGEDPAEIGLRFRPIKDKVIWGLGAFCACLPLLILARVVTQWLLGTVFRNVQTPPHPIISDVTRGGLPFLLSLVIAVVAAPVIEEIAFRGYLYTALRSSVGVWGAALLSAAIFAAIHPTIPGEFLSLLALGVVLAVVREKTGSLLPSMVCHAVNNLLTLLLTYFQS